MKRIIRKIFRLLHRFPHFQIKWDDDSYLLSVDTKREKRIVVAICTEKEAELVGKVLIQQIGSNGKSMDDILKGGKNIKLKRNRTHE